MRATKIDRNTLRILTGAILTEGDRAVITQQLDRGAYEKVNKALLAAGGAWNRKAKAHVFVGDAGEAIDKLCVTGEYASARDVGWFPTPAPLADRLVAMADLRAGQTVLEPSAGEGAIVLAIKRTGLPVFLGAIERDPKRREKLFNLDPMILAGTGHLDDFLNYQPAAGAYDRVVMNPPFARVGRGDHLDHVRHAFTLLVHGGVLVSILPSSISFRQDRRHVEFRAWCEAVGEIDELPAGSFKASGTDVNTVVVRLEKP